MKSFKLYIKEGGPKNQLTWLGAMLMVIAIAIAVVGIFSYFQFSKGTLEEFDLFVRALIIKVLYISAGLGIVGIIFLLAGTFAANSKD